MKTISGCNFKIQNWSWSSIGYRVSGIGYRVLAVGVIIFLSGLFNAGFGQQLKYHFTKGEVLDYDMTEETELGHAVYNETTQNIWKYQFTVVEASTESYVLRMNLNGVFRKTSLSSDNKLLRVTNNSSLVQNSSVVNDITNLEINHPIYFKLDSMGNILGITGVDSLLNSITRSGTERAILRTHENYNHIKVRYSKEYYTWVIHEFFPTIPGSSQDSLLLKSGDRSVTRINIWDSGVLNKEDSLTFKLRRSYRFEPNQPPFIKDQTHEMSVIWDRNSGYPVHIDYAGYLPEDLTRQISLKEGSADLGMIRQVQINNTRRSFIKNSTVQISGQLQNFENKEFTAFCPGTDISKKKIPLVIAKDGKFTFSFNMPVSTGFVEIFFNRINQYLWYMPGNPDQIKIFVEPGDTINLSADINDLKTANFNCRLRKEQILLNSLSREFYSRNPEKSIKTTLNNIRIVQGQKMDLNPQFVKSLDIEHQYSLLTYQVTELSRSPNLPKTINRVDSLQRFLKFLSCPGGYQSDAYKEFLCDFIETYCDLTPAGRMQIYPRAALFETATTIFNGWDLYWYLAVLVESNLEDFPAESNTDENYKKYSAMFPGTVFQRQLFQEYQIKQTGKIGNKIPDLKFTDIFGKTKKTSDLQGQCWGIVNLDKSLGMNEFLLRMADTLNFIYGQNITFIVCSPASTDAELQGWATKDKSKKLFILANSTNNKPAFDYLKVLPMMLIGLDGNNCIASYDQYGMNQFENLYSWPIESPPSKTINLSVFWFSFGGAFVLAVVIVITIRIRSKRKEKRLTLKRKMAQLEVDAVRSRMNPHFLFNALSSIQNLINKKQIEEANLFLARFGDLVRTILTQSSKPAIGLNEEIDMIRNYLQLEQLRFPFQFEIVIDPAIDTFAIEVPPLLIQPHVENAVMHGISSLGANGKIEVSFTIENNHLICKVKDNGPGYHPGTKTGNGGLGQGWKLTRQRIQLMKEQYGDDVSVEVLPVPYESGDSKESSGTTVIFRLPLQKPD